MPIRVRAEAWPLLVVVAEGSLVRSELDVLEREVGAVYARKERFATLVETSQVLTMPDAATRKRLADWQNETRGDIARLNVITATVVSSAVVRGAMTAMNWIFRPPNRQIAVASLDEGLEACVAALRAEGLRLPASLTRAREAPRPRPLELVLSD
ncbi:MAG: hypothetical protein K1X94_22920 [Sandaracinaceae bacterium]|nr:hypothetical protein [Sandaracinaceae bacterium]